MKEIIDNSELNAPKMPFLELDSASKEEFSLVDLPLLKRKEADFDEYHVYEKKDSFKSVKAETVAKAIETSAIASPHHVVHVNCRIPDVIEREKLESIGKVEKPVVESKATEAAPTTQAPAAETSAAPEVQPAPAAESQPG